jgi:hypothetical protein
MRPKTLIGIATFLFLLFVFVGDRILPEPMKSASTRTRTQLNNFVLGLFPSGKPKNLNEEREKKLEQQMNPGSSNEQSN